MLGDLTILHLWCWTIPETAAPTAKAFQALIRQAKSNLENYHPSHLRSIINFTVKWLISLSYLHGNTSTSFPFHNSDIQAMLFLHCHCIYIKAVLIQKDNESTLARRIVAVYQNSQVEMFWETSHFHHIIPTHMWGLQYNNTSSNMKSMWHERIKT